MLYIYCARLHIQSFHFFEPPGRLKVENLIELYSIARTVIDTVAAMDQYKPGTISSCTAYIHRAVILAALSILKLSRGFAAPYFDLNGGEKSYFSAIVILRSMSLNYDDLGARSAIILQNLWDSGNVFRRADGTVDSMALRLRNRLSMSIVFDAFWYWRKEFGGQPSPFKNDEEAPVRGKEPICSRSNY
jgi:transcriptional regulatory protein LEU3